MMRIGNKYITLITLIALSLALIGCSSDVQDQSELATTATFDVTAVSAVKVDDVGAASVGIWSEIPLKRSITFKACLNDVTLQVALQSQAINIETPYGLKNRTTDSSGCLTWNDDFDFAYFSKEELIAYPVSFTGVSGHVGHEELNLQVNPWNLDTSKVLYDTRYDELPEVIKIQQDESFAPIQLRNMALSYIQSGYNNEERFAYYSFRLNGSVEGRRRNTKGNPVALAMQKGQFQLELELIEEKDGNYSKISHTAQIANLEDGVLSHNVQFNFLRGFQHHPDSRFYVLVSFKPVGLPAQTLDSQQHNSLTQTGVLPLNNLQGTNQGALDSFNIYPEALVQSEFKTESIVRETTPFDDSKADEGHSEEPQGSEEQEEVINDNFGVSIANVTLTNGVLLSPEDSTLNARVRRMPITICLADGLSQNSNTPLPMTKIQFKGRQGSTQDTAEERTATTDQNGCFQSYILMSYDYLGCERYNRFTYQVEVMDGRYKGIKKSASLAINPYNSKDLFYDLRLASAPPAIECTAPSIAINQFTYKNEGSDRESFKVNKHLHLSLAKRLSVQFSPKFFRNGSYQEVENHKNLYAGSFELTATILSPKFPHANFFEFAEEEWDHLTSTVKEVSVNSNGMVADELLLPFHLSETLFLSYKNLLLVELKPTGDTNLEPTKIMLPFYATSQSATLIPSLIQGDVSELLRAKINMALNANGKVPGVHVTTEQSSSKLASSPIELYRAKILSINAKREINMNLLHGDHDFFNQLPPVAMSDWSEVSNSQKAQYQTTLSESDMRTLTGYQGQKSDRMLKKFCRAFYSIETNRAELNLCLETPAEFIRITSMSFVDDILGLQDIEIQGSKFSYAKAKFINDDQGKIRRGNAFFAAYGDRSSISTGERDSVSYNTNMSYGLEGPSMVFMGFSQNKSTSQEVYKIKNTTQMKAAFNRNYTSRDLLDLTFERLTLEIPVKTRACITVESLKAVPLTYQICDSRARLKRLRETWFFVGDTNAVKHGIISDANLPGDTNQNQVIRGQQRFNQLWDDMEKQDTLLVIKELGTMNAGDAFESYVQRENQLLPYESSYDHAFPGMIIPFTHAPTNSCTDCQDQ